MRRIILAITTVSLLIATRSSLAETVELPGRIYLGTEFDGPADEWSAFFTADSGFVMGATSHTNTICVSDGNLEACYEITAEGFDANGSPAALTPNAQAVGVGDDTRLSPGESIKFTLDSVSYNVINPDVVVMETRLDEIDMAGDFTEGVDMYTYSGVGAPLATDDTRKLIVDASVVGGDMWTITGDADGFRVLYLSVDTTYSVVPEPHALSLLLIGLLGVVRRR